MPSKRWTEDQLVQLLKERASRLFNMVKTRMPGDVATREVGMVVAAARLLYGRQAVDEQINDFQDLTDACEAGLCENCRKVPVIPGGAVCESCRQEYKRILAEANRKYGLSLSDNSIQ